MPQLTQIVPEHDYPHVMVVEHDNSARPNDKLEPPLQTYCNMMCIFVSPKGIDRKFQTITRGFKGFKEAYGIGSYDVYGQPYLNAYAAAKTDAATLHCMRLTADDATFSMGALVAHYKTTPAILSQEVPEDVIAESDILSLLGRQNIAAGDEIPGGDYDVTIHVAGTEITPEISMENADIFPGVKGKYIDVTLDLEKIIGAIDDDGVYKLTQENDALSNFPNDQYISQDPVTLKWTKERTYKGSELKEGFSVLLGTDSRVIGTITKVEDPPPPEPENPIVNNTDMNVYVPDDNKLTGTVISGDTNGTKTYQITVGGEIKPKTVSNAELWGDISTFPDCFELTVRFPTLDPSKTYVIRQVNPILEKYYPDDNRIKQEGAFWVKEQRLTGAVLNENDVSVLLGTPVVGSEGDVSMSVYDSDSYVSSVSPKEFTINFVNNVSYVSEYTPDPPPPPKEEDGPIEVGEKRTFLIDAAIAFKGETASSILLRAQSLYNSLNKAAYNAWLEENGDPDFVPTEGNLEIFYTFETPELAPRNRENLGELVEVDEETVDADGFRQLKVFEMVCRGRGTYGDNVRFMLKNYPRGDKLSNYKNYWLNVYEIEDATLYLKETFNVDFIPDALNMDGEALFADYIMGDPFNNSSYVDIKTNPLAIRTLYAEYMKAKPDTGCTLNEFDPMLGYVYGSSLKKLPNLSIDTTRPGAVALGGASGIALRGGSNGAFEANMPGREDAINRAYLQAWTGEIDRNIFSRKLYPTDIILDADYTYEVKRAIADLTHRRMDCVTFYDLGTNFNSYNGMLEELAELEPDVYTRDEAIEAYWGKIQDPVTYKIIKVTSTYPLASMYPNHFREQGAKHVALAGSAYGVIQGYISGSPQLVFDDDLDSVEMDEMTELRINYLKVNSLKQIVRGTQTTRQDLDTNLSECSNVFVLHDIRRDCIIMCEGFEYNFLELSELQRFNKSAEIVAAKYAAAQVRSISATYDVNEWEYDRGILHLYVEFVHKNLVKRAIVEIDINRGRLMD